MAGLSVYSFDQYAQGDSIQDILEVRLGDALAVNIQAWADATKTTPQNLTGWTFAVTYLDCIATFSGTQTTLASITNLSVLNTTPQTDANLVITTTAPLIGQAVLTIPATVTGMPAASAPIGTDTTLFKLIEIKTTFPSPSLASFNNILKPTIGVIVRYAF